MTEIDFNTVTSAAYTELIRHRVHRPPVDPLHMHFSGVEIMTYEQYAEMAELGAEIQNIREHFSDGIFSKNLRPGLRLILYESHPNLSRRKHTILHEIGHYRLDHQIHGDREEVEAHFFASQVLMPNAVLRHIRQRGYQITLSLLRLYFGVSRTSATKKLEYLERYPFTHENEHDGALFHLFWQFLDTYFPDLYGRNNTSFLRKSTIETDIEETLLELYGPSEEPP